MRPFRILFVCLGNICRSPMAEGAFRKRIAEIDRLDDYIVASAGTGRWHVGDPPDRRAVAACLARGIDIGELRARQVGPADFGRFDVLVAMDRSNAGTLLRMAPEGAAHKIRLMMEFAPLSGEVDVPDPYQGGTEGFDTALDMIEAASDGLIAACHATLDDMKGERPPAAGDEALATLIAALDPAGARHGG
ncbi:MAG: low molecular weight protein-tyrosine-phosphatase [Hyphomicrobiaceae bacterium]